MKAWHEKHPEYERERSKRRYATDPRYRARIRANERRFKAEHPEYYRNAAKIRRARLAGAICTLTRDESIQLFEDFEGRCAYCPNAATTIDHVVPISRGGAHSKTNVLPACKTCNSSKGTKSLLEWLA